MHVQLVDPSAFTPPYDRALAAALAGAGERVELLTGPFLHGRVPAAEGYRVEELFYRRSGRRGRHARGRLALKMAEHVPDMIRLRSRLDADLTHYQWLTVPAVDAWLLPPNRPRVMTAHYVLGPAASRAETAIARNLFGRMDAVIAHSDHGARRLVDLVGVEAARVRVIPHGAFDYLTRLPDPAPLPAELRGAEGPVILFFGLLRPYKGIDVLLDAFSRLEAGAAELWIVGNPRMDVSGLRRLAEAAPGRVRWVTRFVDEREIPAIFERADVVTLPYRDAEQSGVLYTGLAFGKAMALTRVGGLDEVADDQGAALAVAPEDPRALAGALGDLVADGQARAELGAAAAAAAAGPYSWTRIAELTRELYRELPG